MPFSTLCLLRELSCLLVELLRGRQRRQLAELLFSSVQSGMAQVFCTNKVVPLGYSVRLLDTFLIGRTDSGTALNGH